MADELLVDMRQDLPSAFNAAPEILSPQDVSPQDVSPQDVSSPIEEPVIDDEPAVEAPFQDLPETQQDSVEQVTDVEEDGSPKDVEIEEVTEADPEFDELSITEFKEMIDGLKYRYSQGKKRQKYEEILGVAEKAQDYFDAYKEWHDHAHKLFDDEPIKLKIE